MVVMEVLVERAPVLVLMEEEREPLVWALRVKVRERMEKVPQKVAVQKGKAPAAVNPVVGMVRERLRWKERIQVRCCHRA